MKRLQLLFLWKKATVVYLQRRISTHPVLLARGRKGNVAPGIAYEPGIRHRREVFQQDAEITEDVEDEIDIDHEINAMNLDQAYDINMEEQRRNRNKLKRMVIAKKFFSPRPQPAMLTVNERQCIKYLHEEDPVQWDIKTLSESFPATPDAIKKVIKANWKVTPEEANRIDSKVQKNWELLAQGQLDADPEVLEHLKKFINRRHVLLDQIKNEKFYLPEIKKEPVWNNGEFTNVLVKYEKAVKRLVRKTEKSKMLESGIPEEKCEEDENKSALDVVHEKVREAASKRRSENKDSFLYGSLTGSHFKESTLEEMEHDLLTQAEKNKPLSVLDKAILESKLGEKFERQSENLTPTESLTPERTKRSWQSRGRTFEGNDMREAESFTPERTKRNWQSRGRNYEESDMREAESFTPERTERNWQSRGRSFEGNDMKEAESFTPERTKRNWQSRGRNYEESDMREAESFTPERTKRNWQSRGRNYEESDMREAESFTPERTKRNWQSRGRNYESDMRGEFTWDRNMISDDLETDKDNDLDSDTYPNDGTLRGNETEIGKILMKVRGKEEPVEPKPEAEEKEKKPEIEFSDPERIRRENMYYDAEVKYIENTAFWNNGRNSKQKALAELEKPPHSGPPENHQTVPLVKSSILSVEPYPLKIKIPVDKRGSGFTFKVKDCYYDDDGTFLYRVPSMT